MPKTAESSNDLPWQPPLLAIPPFPGSQTDHLRALIAKHRSGGSLEQCVALLREKRVGGTFWGCATAPACRYFLVRSTGTLPSDLGLGPEFGEPCIWCPADARQVPHDAIVGTAIHGTC
jgi:hypothetical protein